MAWSEVCKWNRNYFQGVCKEIYILGPWLFRGNGGGGAEDVSVEVDTFSFFPRSLEGWSIDILAMKNAVIGSLLFPDTVQSQIP